MHIDILPLPRGPRRGASERLREELQALAGGHAEFLAREGQVEAAENFIAYLPEHEFAIRGQLVADAAVTSVDHRIGPGPRMEVRIELLLLDED